MTAFLLKHWRVWLLLACVVGLFWFGYHTKASIDAREALVAKLQADLADARRASAQAAVTERVVTKYVDRVRTVQGVTRTIIKEVPVYVSSDLPALPGAFRVFHDAAVQGVVPDPAGIADAAPVAPAVVAETVAGNYGTCHETAAQLTALQDWIRQQQAVK